MEIESEQRLREGPNTSRSRRRAWFALLMALGLCVAGCIVTTTFSLSYLSSENGVVLPRIYRPRHGPSRDGGSASAEETTRAIDSTLVDNNEFSEQVVNDTASTALGTAQDSLWTRSIETATETTVDANSRSIVSDASSATAPVADRLASSMDVDTNKEPAQPTTVAQSSSLDAASRSVRGSSSKITREEERLVRMSSEVGSVNSANHVGSSSPEVTVRSRSAASDAEDWEVLSDGLTGEGISASSSDKQIVLQFDTPTVPPTVGHASDSEQAGSVSAGSENGENLNSTGGVTSAQQTSKRFAYMFYATSDVYACATLQLMNGLVNRVGMDTGLIELVLLHGDSISEALLRRARELLNVRTIPVELLRAATADSAWETSLTKLRVFQDWGYARVVYLDSDAVVMQSLDHLFDLPPGRLYAPTAYWLPQPFFASTLMVIEPSDAVFQNILAWARVRGEAAGFDMDILNAYFADAAHYLPGEYTVLNSDFRQPSSAPTKLFSTTAELKAKAMVVHYSCTPDGSYGKPWAWTRYDLSMVDNAGYDPLFRELFIQYWQDESRLCN